MNRICKTRADKITERMRAMRLTGAVIVKVSIPEYGFPMFICMN